MEKPGPNYEKLGLAFSGLEDKNRPKTNDEELQLPKMILEINYFAALAFLGALGKKWLVPPLACSQPSSGII